MSGIRPCLIQQERLGTWNSHLSWRSDPWPCCISSRKVGVLKTWITQGTGEEVREQSGKATCAYDQQKKNRLRELTQQKDDLLTVQPCLITIEKSTSIQVKLNDYFYPNSVKELQQTPHHNIETALRLTRL